MCFLVSYLSFLKPSTVPQISKTLCLLHLFYTRHALCHLHTLGFQYNFQHIKGSFSAGREIHCYSCIPGIGTCP